MPLHSLRRDIFALSPDASCHAPPPAAPLKMADTTLAVERSPFAPRDARGRTPRRRRLPAMHAPRAMTRVYAAIIAAARYFSPMMRRYAILPPCHGSFSFMRCSTAAPRCCRDSFRRAPVSPASTPYFRCLSRTICRVLMPVYATTPRLSARYAAERRCSPLPARQFAMPPLMIRLIFAARSSRRRLLFFLALPPPLCRRRRAA